MSGHGVCLDRTSDVCVPMDTTFEKMDLINEIIRKGLSESKFIVPSPIQRAALPRTLCGFDAVFLAKSGTGKTAVFVISALQSILDLETNQPQVLILAPTREIAVQIVDVTKSIGKFIDGLKVDWFIGGTPLQDDVAKLKNCRIIVGAPGRIKQLIELGHLSTKSIRLFVVDEADQMIQPSFYKDFNFIFNNLPQSKQVLICSATFTYNHIEYLRKYMSTFCLISADKEDDVPLEEKLSFESLVGMRPFVSLIADQSYSGAIQFSLKLTQLEKILNTTTFSQCLIFSNYKTRVKTIHNQLCEKGFLSTFLSSEQSQPERLQALEDLKHNRCRILVTTDLASRGIDAQNVNTVINFEVPCDEQTYLHRMGRAGRYGSNGIVITITSEGEELKSLKKIIGAIKGSVLVLPTEPLVDATDVSKVQSLGLDEISGSNDQEQQPPFEDDSDETYVFRKEFLKERYGCDIEDLDLKSFKSDIDHHVQKLAGNRELTFDMDAYFSLCKSVEYFHPELVEYVEKAVSNASLNKKPPSVSAGDLKENIPMNVCNRNQKAKRNNRSQKVESTVKNQKQNAAFGSPIINRKYRLLRSEEFFEEILLEKLLTFILKDTRASDIKSSVEKNFAELKHSSSDFAAKLVPILTTNKILANDLTDFSSGIINFDQIKSHYYFCKTFKCIDSTLVSYVERRLKEKKDFHFKNIQGSASSTKVGFEKCASGVPLPPSSIKKKPEKAKSTAPKNTDPPKQTAPKYLYLKQKFLKTLYGSTKVNKDFCVESFRPWIEQGFTGLWNSAIISTDVTELLSRLDILRRPPKYLNNWTLEPLFQFSRHFDFLNPELVHHVSTKIEVIEAGRDISDNSSKNSGCLPKEILALYYSKSDNLTDLKIDDQMKDRIRNRFSTKPDALLKLKEKLGTDIFVDQSFEGNYFVHYFRLCQVFSEIDVEFISYVNQKVKEMALKCQNVTGESHTNAPKIVAPIEVHQGVPETSAQLSTASGSQPSDSDSSSVVAENFITQSYEELVKYPTGKSVRNSRTINFNGELNLNRNRAHEHVAFADSASFRNTVKLLYKDDETILKTVVKNTAQESTQPYNELRKYAPCKSGPVNSTPVDVNLINNAQLIRSVTNCAKPVTFSNRANYQEAVKLLYNDREEILNAVRSKASDTLQNGSPHQDSVDFLVDSEHNQVVETSSANLSSQERSVIFSRQQDVTSKSYIDQNQSKSGRKPSKIQAFSSKSDQKVNGEAKRHRKISSPTENVKRGYISSDWTTASSSDSDLNEEGLFTTYNGSMNLCDRCKNWYSTENAEVPETRAKSKKSADSKVSGKKASKSHKKRSSHGSAVNPPCPVPSYEQLIQWYSMWYQQVVFSQQFVWWNEYIRSMSSRD